MFDIHDGVERILSRVYPLYRVSAIVIGEEHGQTFVLDFDSKL